MENKQISMIIKIMGLVGAVFCGISLILPWSGLWIGGFGYSIYPWGTSSNVPGVAEGWDFFFINSIGTGATEAIVLSIVMIVAFILTLVALIIGILGAKNIGIKVSNSLLIAGILSIVAIILCVVAVSQANSYYQSLGVAGFAFGYGAGFFLIIIGMILYFVTFGLQKFLLSAPAPGMAQQPMYQQPSYQQPQMMYTSTQQPPVQQTAPTAPPQPQTPPPPAQAPPKTRAAQKFCPECGAQLQPNAKFCSGCGNKI